MKIDADGDKLLIYWSYRLYCLFWYLSNVYGKFIVISKLEENVRKNRRRKDSFLTKETTQQGLGIYNGKIEGEDNIIKEILRYKKINELKLSF